MTANAELGDEAARLANEISAICAGQPSVAVYMALSMVLGGSAAPAQRPDFEQMMALVERTAFDQFNRAIQRKRRGRP